MPEQLTEAEAALPGARARLEAQVAARPGDPVGHAELAAALRGQPEAEAARTKARELVVGCLHLGLHEPAVVAAEVLHRAFGGVDDAVLWAEAAAARRGAGDLERQEPGRGRGREPARRAAGAAPRGRVRARRRRAGGGAALIEPVAHQTAETSALYVQTLFVAGDNAQAALVEARSGVEAHSGSAELWEMPAAALERGLRAGGDRRLLRGAAPRARAAAGLLQPGAGVFAQAGSLPAALGGRRRPRGAASNLVLGEPATRCGRIWM
ncbi:MAG: hypothetical protein U1F43_36635 [Myxococcota bacterium]